jgi:hypothetical protein
MATFAYPVNGTLREVGQVLLPQLTMDDLAFQIMPIRDEDASLLMWEQMDDFIGLQQIRGLNGEPPKVQPVGAKSYIMQPGVYGEYLDIDEKQITERRQLGTWDAPIDVGDLVAVKQRQLLGREIDRIRYIVWTLLTTGIFSVNDVKGGVAHTDTFSLGTSSGSDWSTVATATPLADLRAVQLTGPAQGTDFGSGSLAVVNRQTANYLLANTNAADLGGKRTSGLANVLSMGEVNTLLTGEGLPNIVVYDKGYKNDAGTFTRFVPNDKVVVVGVRPAGAPVGEYLMTRNANNPNSAPGPYDMVEDTMEQNKPPRYIRVHRGHNGGPVIYYPGSVVIMSV